MPETNHDILLNIIESCRDALLAHVEQPDVSVPDTLDVPQLKQAIAHFTRILQAISAAPANLSCEEVSDLGEHGTQLISELQAAMQEFGLDEQYSRLLEAQVLFGLWVAAHNGEIRVLEPIVDALAYVANHAIQPEQLAIMSRHAANIINAVAPHIKQDLDNTNPGRPWRLLNLNYGIIATRSHNPELMRTSFATLVHNIPDDVAEFFAEGMKQMDIINYPPQVREVMEDYYRQWHKPQILH
ncbi:MAG: hypothetical protein PVF75_05700 [Granulosicoccaceae bacterium]|jgi:hypothetical protein